MFLKKILLVISLILNVFVFSGYTEPIEKDAKIVFNDIKVKVDGKLIDIKDISGNKVEPFMYNGMVYAPINSIGKAFGKNVEWDGKTNTIFIGRIDSDKPNIYLNQMEYFNFQKKHCKLYKWEPNNHKDSTGAAYDNGIIVWGGGPANNYIGKGLIEYLLNQKYKTIKGRFGLCWDSRNAKSDAILRILGDEKVLYTSPIMKGGELPIDFKIDITGIIKLSIELKDLKGYYCLVDVGLFE